MHRGKRSVKIGDEICLYSEELKGYVYSCQSSSAFNELAIEPHQSRRTPAFPNIHGAVFTIFVQNRYKFTKELPSLMKQVGDASHNANATKLLQQTKEAAAAEEQDNAQQQKRQTGKPLLYGQTIQLQHKFTGNFIHVNNVKTSSSEISNMMVELKSENGKTAQFKVMPTYKVKSEGDMVQEEDQLVLESVKCPGQYLHCSLKTIANSPYDKSNELNLSVRASSFSVYMHWDALERQDSSQGKNRIAAGKEPLKGGCLIRLYHREQESYVVADGMNTPEFLESPSVPLAYSNGRLISEVADKSQLQCLLRVRPVDQTEPRTLYPSTSAITYWQIEKHQSIVDGSTIKVNDACRLRNFTSRLYLKVTQEGKVKLTSDPLDDSSVFKLHPVTPEGEVVRADSYVRIENVNTGRWLHSNGKLLPFQSQEQRTESSDQFDKMKNLVWSTAQLKQLSSSKEMQYNDAFTLQLVEDDSVLQANFAAGQVPYLYKELVELSWTETPVARSQLSVAKICASLQELADFMIVDEFPQKTRQKLMRDFLIIDLIVMMLKLASAKTMADKIGRLFESCFHVLYVYLKGDSRKNELYMARYMDYFIQRIQTQPDAVLMVMELLRDNRKVIDCLSQQHIHDFCTLLRNHRDYRYLDLLNVLCICDGIPIQANQNLITEIYLVRNHGHEKSPILFTEVGNKLNKQKESHTVFISTDGKQSWQSLFDFAKKSNATSYKFLEYQLKLFSCLCRGRNDYSIQVITEKLKYLTWEEAFLCISDERMPDSLRAVYVSLINDLFIEVGSNNSVLDSVDLVFVFDDIPLPGQPKRDFKKEGILSHVEPLPFLKDLKTWISQFLQHNSSMIGSQIGRNDLIGKVLELVHSLAKFGYYGETEDISALLTPLMSLVDGRNDLPYSANSGLNTKHNQRSVANYKKKERFIHNLPNATVMKAKSQALRVLELIFNFRFNTRLERFLSEFKRVMKQKHDEQSELTSSKSKVNVFKQRKVEKMLKNMFEETAYFDDDFVVILLDLCHYENEVLVRQSLSLLNCYFSGYGRLFERAVQAQVLITDGSSKAFRQVQSRLPRLKLLLTTGKIDTSSVAEELSLFTNMCHYDKSPFTPNQMNQRILFNSGAFGDVLDILNRKNVSQTNEVGQQNVTESLRFLTALARNFMPVQERLFNRLADLLALGTESIEHLAFLLEEMFINNKTLSLRLLPTQIHAIVSLLATQRSSALCNVVLALVNIDGVPMKRNQTVVVKSLLQHKDSISLVADSGKKEHLRVLTASEDNSKAVEEKCFFSNIIRVLAYCAFGENRTVESICQAMLSVDELLDIVNNEQVCCGLKKPFVEYLQAVFLKPSFSSLKNEDERVFYEIPDLWRFLTSVAEKMDELSSYAQKNTALCRQLLERSPVRPHLSRDDVKHETKEALFYVLDAVIPFLTLFFRDVYRQPADQLFADRVGSTVDQLHAAVTKFGDIICPILPSTTNSLRRLQRRDLSQCWHAINNSRNEMVFDNQPLFTTEKKLSEESKDTIAQGQDYAYYEEERHLNECLNNYAENLQKAYGGKNTVRAQLGKGSDKRMYCSEQKLPMGEEFQELVDCFDGKSSSRRKQKKVKDEGKDEDTRYGKAAVLLQQLKSSMNVRFHSEQEKMKQAIINRKCLQVLRALVHNRIVLAQTDKDEKEVLAVQTELVEMKVFDTILPYMSLPDEDLSMEVFALMNTLLHNGDPTVQRAMIEHFLGTREETFFQCLKTSLDRSAEAIREQRILLSTAKPLRDNNAEFMSRLTSAASGSDEQHQLSENSFGPNKSILSWQGILKSLEAKVTFLTLKGSKISPTMQHSQRKVTKSIKNNGKAQKEVQRVSSDNLEIEMAQNQEASSSAQQHLIHLLESKSSTRVFMVLKLMALPCLGQNDSIQNYMREQKDNIKSFNLVAETVNFLELTYSAVDDSNIDLVTQICSTLTEFVRGNHANQTVAYDNKLIDYTNFILRRDVYPGCTPAQTWKLKQTISELLLCIIEENTKSMHVSPIVDSISQRSCERIMVQAYNALESGKMTFFRSALQEASLSTVKKTGINFKIILDRSNDLGLNPISCPSNPSADLYFSKKVASVETVKDNVLQRVYFPINSQLSDMFKTRVIWNIDRSSPSAKLHDLLSWSEALRQDLKFQRFINSVFIARWLVYLWSPINVAVLLLTFIINAFILGAWIAPEKVNPSYLTNHTKFGLWEYTHLNGEWYDQSIFYLSVLHNVLSCLLFLSYLFSAKPQLPKLCRRNKKASKLDDSILSTRTAYYLLFVIISVLGTTFSNALFGFHLLHIAVNNQLLSRVIQAITLNGKSLLWVAFMGLIIFYLFALVAFSLFRDIFHDNDLFCSTMWECFLTMIREGLLYGLTERFDISVENPRFSFTYYAIKLLFDVSFFVLITTIGLNIVFGIIVDTFSELRDNKWQIENDIKTTCFICSKNAFDFEKDGLGFNKHIQQDHNIWNYMLFFIYLEEKIPAHLYANERHVYNMVHADKVDFFPLCRAMSIEDRPESEGTEEILAELARKVEWLYRRAKAQEELNVDEEKRRQNPELVHY